MAKDRKQPPAEPPKARLVRMAGVERLLDAVLAEPDPQRADRLMRNAMIMRLFAKINEARRAHIGRPAGTTGARIDDGDALAYMRKLFEDGEQRPHRLARLAVDARKVDLGNSTRDAVIKRLAERWKRQNVQK